MKMNNTTLFCSDLHLYHNKVLDFDKERWKKFWNIEEHNLFIKEEIKSIPENYDLFILWDIVWQLDKKTIMEMHEFFQSVKCNMHRILWNHDYQKIVNEYSRYFTSIQDYFEWKYEWRKFVLFHYPILSWNWWFRERGSIHLHWHDHKHTTFIEWDRFNIAYNWKKLLYNIEWFINWEHKEFEKTLSI